MHFNLPGQFADHRWTNHGSHGAVLLALLLDLLLEGGLLGVFACCGCREEDDGGVVFHGETAWCWEMLCMANADADVSLRY